MGPLPDTLFIDAERAYRYGLSGRPASIEVGGPGSADDHRSAATGGRRTGALRLVGALRAWAAGLRGGRAGAGARPARPAPIRAAHGFGPYLRA